MDVGSKGEAVTTEVLTAALAPVQRLDVTEFVVERLRGFLEKGVLKPGSKLPPEVEMCKALGVSRPSLRQAYKALDILGVIHAIPGDGTYIRESTSKMLAMPLTFLMLMKKISLDDVFELRIILEGELAALAATRASSGELTLIRLQLEQMATRLGDDQKPSYLEAEYEFHNCIARAAHNILLLEINSIVGGLLWETRKMLVDFVPDRRADLGEHRDIYTGISARDPQAARNSMLRHLHGALNLTKTDAFIKKKDV